MVTVGQQDFEVSDGEGGVLFRLYYPASVDTAKEYERSYWLPKAFFYAWGYLDSIGVTKILLGLVLPFVSFVQTPDLQSPPLLKRFQPQASQDSATLSDGEASYPVAIFSHGLSGMRTTYSIYCRKMAERGMIVASIEHRDGSACVAAKDNYKNYIRFKRPNEKEKLPGQTYDEYLLQYRQSQVAKKVGEVKRVFKILEKLDQGSPIDNIMTRLSSSESRQFNLQFKDQLDFSKAVLIGHSFGGASTLTLLQEKDHPFACGVSLDPWMFAVENKTVLAPILSMQSEFFHWRANLDAIRTLFEKRDDDSIFSVVLGTKHQDFSDLGVLFPSASRRMGISGPSDPKVSLEIMHRCTMAFLEKHGIVKSFDPDYFKRKQVENGQLLLSQEAFRHLYDIIDKQESSKKNK